MYTYSSPLTRAAREQVRAAITLTAIGLLGSSARSLQAQTPQRLPGMSVIAAPGAKIFMGVVNDTAGFLLEGVEVSIPSLKRRTVTKADGTFRFDDIDAGKYAIRARKVGYAPQVRPFKVDKDGARGTFDLIPLPYSLPTVTVSTVRGGLFGTVADTGYNPVAGADVRLLGKRWQTKTDSLGTFFLPAREGSFMLAIKKEGYADRVAGVTVPSDSGRRISVFLLPAHPIPAREGRNILALQQRLAWREPLKDGFYTREDIQRLDIEWIYDLVRMYGMDQYSDDCSVAVNGGPATRRLGDLTVDDVESVEIYGGARFAKPASVATHKLPPISFRSSSTANVIRVAKATPRGRPVSLELGNVDEAGFENQGLTCPIVHVWMR